MLAVQRDPGVLEPSRCRVRADEEEEVAYRLLGFLAGRAVAPAYALQLPFPAAIKRDHLRVRQHLDIVEIRDPVDQVARHALCEAWSTDQHPDFFCEVAQEYGGLARGISASDQNDLLVPTQACLDRRSPIPNAPPLETRHIPHVEAAVAGA